MDQKLFDLALLAMANAYAPYSKFQVGSAIRTSGGQVFSGSNVENAAYGESCCAEAAAIAAMVTAGERQIKQVVVVGKGDALVTPCGGCRQKILEFAAVDTVIDVCGPEGLRRSFTIKELLPASFGPHNLTEKPS